MCLISFSFFMRYLCVHMWQLQLVDPVTVRDQDKYHDDWRNLTSACIASSHVSAFHTIYLPHQIYILPKEVKISVLNTQVLADNTPLFLYHVHVILVIIRVYQYIYHVVYVTLYLKIIKVHLASSFFFF